RVRIGGQRQLQTGIRHAFQGRQDTIQRAHQMCQLAFDRQHVEASFVLPEIDVVERQTARRGGKQGRQPLLGMSATDTLCPCVLLWQMLMPEVGIEAQIQDGTVQVEPHRIHPLPIHHGFGLRYHAPSFFSHLPEYCIAMPNPVDLLPAVCRIAAAAGRATLSIYHSDFAVDTKANDSPLTQADVAAHRLIADGLQQLTPAWPQLSEEGSAITYATRRQWTRYWLIDPLDGTREFVNRNDQFTINIALIEHQQPVLGVVYAPVYDTLWYGSVAGGAY